jgi:nitrogenase subunit NifH
MEKISINEIVSKMIRAYERLYFHKPDKSTIDMYRIMAKDIVKQKKKFSEDDFLNELCEAKEVADRF